MRFFLSQVTRENHPTIGYAVVAHLNEYGSGVRILGVIYHPPNQKVSWLENQGEMAEIIIEHIDGDKS